MYICKELIILIFETSTKIPRYIVSRFFLFSDRLTSFHIDIDILLIFLCTCIYDEANHFIFINYHQRNFIIM